MGKPASAAIRAAKYDIAKTVSRAMRAVYHGIGQRTKEDLQSAYSMPQSEAPLWAHTAAKLAVAEVRANLNDTKVVNTNLNLVMISRAENVEAWSAMAEPFRRPQLEAKPIDVPAVPVTEKVPAAK